MPCIHHKIKHYTIKQQPRFWRGWRKSKPGYKEKRVMFEECGAKCFLDPPYEYPICKNRTCKISKKGVMSAYIRAKQYNNKRVTRKAMRHLKKMHIY